MQMIRPVTIGAEQLESSTANAQVLPEWAPEGRDLLSGLRVHDFQVSGSELWVSASGMNRFDLPTGEHLPTNGATGRAFSISPDKNWIASIAFDNSRFEVRDISSGAVVYAVEDGDRANSSQYVGNIDWASDSSFVALTEKITDSSDSPSRLLCILVDQWQESASPRINDYGGSESFVFGTPYGRVRAENGKAYYFYGYRTEINNNFTDVRALGEFDPATGTYSEHVVQSGEPPLSDWDSKESGGSYSYFYNSTNSLFIITRGDGTVFSVDLNGNKGLDAPTGAESIGIQSISLSQNGELLIEAANPPHYREYSASDYSFIGDYPGAYNVMTGEVQFSSNYAAGVRRPGDDGYALIDLSDNTEVSQNNPSVSDGDRYIYNSKIWEALADNNDRPDEGAAASPPTWVDQGFINPLRMFDGSVGSRTTADDVLEVSIAPDGGQINAIALLNMQGASARVTMTDPDEGQVYDSGEIELLDNSTIQDWYSFFFEPYIELTQSALTDLPPYPDAEITITVDSQGATAALGELVVGSLFKLGEAQYGSSVGIADFSRKERDEFGNFNIVERGYSDTAEMDVHIDSARTPGVKNVLSRYRAKPAVFIGAESKPSTIIYGYFFNLDIVLSNFSFDEATIEIEGLQ